MFNYEFLYIYSSRVLISKKSFSLLFSSYLLAIIIQVFCKVVEKFASDLAILPFNRLAVGIGYHFCLVAIEIGMMIMNMNILWNLIIEL